MQNFMPFTQTQRDNLIVASLNRPARNIDALLGPRCVPCSGLGHYLKLGGGDAGVTRSTSKCGCDGSGIDFGRLERASHDELWRRIGELQRALDLPNSLRPHDHKMSRQFWMECIAWATADGTAVANTVTETIMFPNVTIPANYMQDGRGIRIKAAGKYSTLGSGTVTHVFKARWGGATGTLLATTGTITVLISMTNALFEIELMIQTRSNGATGTLLVDGVARAFGATAPTIGSATGAPAVAPMTAGGQTAPAAVTVDLTADTALSLTETHGAASASNTLTGMHYTLESLN